MHFLALFHTAIPIQPPPLRGTSFQRKEGVYTRAPSLGRGKGRSEAGLASFFAALGCSRIIAHLRRSPRSFSYRFPPSNLRPFGAPPSIGRRECTREPLPLEGAAEHSEAGLASFWGGEAASSLPSPRVKGFAGETVFTFLHPSHAKTTVSYERSFLCVLLA